MESRRPLAFSSGSGRCAPVPSYAEQLLVDALIAEGFPEISYLRLQDSDPAAPPAGALLVRGGVDVLEPPGETLRAERIDLVVDGVVLNSHWFGSANDDGRVHRVKSAWNGAVSYPDTGEEFSARLSRLF